MSQTPQPTQLQTVSPKNLSLSLASQQIRRLSIKEYHWMGEEGILGPEERLELIDGVIIKMSPVGIRHAAVVGRIINRFPHIFGNKVWIRAQDPVVLNNYTEPEPDVMLLKPRDDTYSTAHPRPEEVLLLIEVSDTTLQYDQTIKLPRYAADGIAEVWIVNTNANVIEAYRTPVERPDGTTGYETRTDYHTSDTIATLAFPDIDIPVANIL